MGLCGVIEGSVWVEVAPGWFSESFRWFYVVLRFSGVIPSGSKEVQAILGGPGVNMWGSMRWFCECSRWWF